MDLTSTHSDISLSVLHSDPSQGEADEYERIMEPEEFNNEEVYITTEIECPE